MSSKKPFTVYGIHAVSHALACGRVESVWFVAERRDQRLQILLEQISAEKCRSHCVNRTQLSELTGVSHHQGIAAKVTPPPTLSENDLDTLLQNQVSPFFLILDQVQDPHNLGACLRTALATGVTAVIVPKNRAASLTPAVYKASSGAAELMPLIQVTNLARTLKALQAEKIWLVGMVGQAQKSLYQQNLTGSIGIVLGAEGTGIRQKTAALCDFLVSIPLQAPVESLNVSVATGVALYECVRQRG